MVNSSLGASASANPAKFNLDSQKGVTHLLASLRVAQITKEQKNELRDLVFQYTNGGRDQSTRIAVEHKIAGYGIEALPGFAVDADDVEKNAEPAQQHPFGTSRPAPTFTPSKSEASNSPTKEVSEPQAIPDTPAPQQAEPVSPPVAPAPEQAPAPVQEPVVAPAPSTPPVAPVPEPVQEPATPTPEPVTPTPVVVPEPVAPPVQPTPAPAVDTQPPAEVVDSAQSLQRIREIKSLVNEKIGNPVNLVDINNEVGREYMSAMLDAMKKLNTGSSAVSAMKRLETAYATVEKTLAEHVKNPTPQQEVEPTPAPETEAQVESVAQISKVEVESTQDETLSDQVVENVEVQPQQVPVIEEPVPVTPVSEMPSAETEVALSVEPEVPQAPVPKPDPEPIPAEPAPDNKQTAQSVATEEASAWGPATDTIQKNEGGIAHSLAETADKLKTPDDLPKSSEIETSSVSGDPLFTKEVDDGLQQLLAEWSIFKKSGLFGTGPKGREHPLFIKIAKLQIPLLLAGRFEGATQEIKQSITDYMNGWRYEQGIIYEHGEDFEHYLRRVIRHIIDLQKSKRPA